MLEDVASSVFLLSHDKDTMKSMNQIFFYEHAIPTFLFSVSLHACLLSQREASGRFPHLFIFFRSDLISSLEVRWLTQVCKPETLLHPALKTEVLCTAAQRQWPAD